MDCDQRYHEITIIGTSGPTVKRADKLAKKGASCPQTDVLTSLEKAKQLIRCNKKESRMNE